MNFEDYETLPTQNVVTHMTAGAIAGIMEHCVMYPLDSVKTRMQSLGVSNNMTVLGTLKHMVQQEGVFRPVRGMSAVVMGAGPAHALYFSTYEFSKETLSQMTSQKHKHLVYGASGCLASLVHDGISNPTEAYEFIQNITNKERGYNPAAHMLSGAIAGAIAAAATTPLDVCKTVLNTQEPGARAKGFFDAVQHILRLSGPTGFFKGIRARVLYQMPAAAICWSTYETFKFLLTGGSEGESLKAAEKLKVDKEKVINLRLVLPQASVKAENTESELSGGSSSGPSSDGLKGLKTMELPAVSGANLYGTLSLNTVHHGDCQVPTLRNT